MRAALHKWWPDLAAVFGLFPDDVPRFSVAEWSQYVDTLQEIAHQRRSSRGS